LGPPGSVSQRYGSGYGSSSSSGSGSFYHQAKIVRKTLISTVLRLLYDFYVTDGNIMYLTDASRFLISCVIQHYAPVVGWGRWRNRCIMLIMSLDPSWRQTLSLPLTPIEPGSPASQARTLPKELSRQLIPVLRIRDVYPRSRILIFSHPGS
jgi:hypothetical protein